MLDVLPFGLSRRTLLYAGVGLWAAFVAWLLLSDSNEEKIRARLDDLAIAVGWAQDENLAFRALRLKSHFAEALDPNVRFSAPELPATTGSHALTQLAASAPRFFGELDVSIGATDVDVNEAEATATSEVTLTGNSGDFTRDTRRVQFTLRASGGEWRVSRIEVEAKPD